MPHIAQTQLTLAAVRTQLDGAEVLCLRPPELVPPLSKPQQLGVQTACGDHRSFKGFHQLLGGRLHLLAKEQQMFVEAGIWACSRLMLPWTTAGAAAGVSLRRPQRGPSETETTAASADASQPLEVQRRQPQRLTLNGERRHRLA